MATSEERFAHGIELMRTMVGDEQADRAAANQELPVKDVLGEFSDWAIENGPGFLLRRPGLSMRDKAIAMLGVDIASLKSRSALQEHARLALLNGVTSDELYEICFLLVWYCGMPSVREAMGVIAEAIDEFQSTLEESGDEHDGRQASH